VYKYSALVLIAAMVLATAAILVQTPAVASSVAPTSMKAIANTKVKLSITVTNDTSDNVENVRFVIHGDPSPPFTVAIGGGVAGENLKLAADNIENAVAPLNRAAENLKLAAENLKKAGQALQAAASYLETVSYRASILGWENVPNLIDQAKTFLGYAGDNLAADTVNFAEVVSNLKEAASYLNQASGGSAPGENENMDYYNPNAAENLFLGADNLDNAADNLDIGTLRGAAAALENAGEYLRKSGENLRDNNEEMGTAMRNAGNKLKEAATNLLAAATYENYAGIALAEVKNYLLSAGGLIVQADNVNLKTAGENLENAALQIGYVADNFKNEVDNIFTGGDNLAEAAIYLSNTATLLGSALGGTELAKAKDYENKAADNMKKATMNLVTAGDQLKLAATWLSAAASTMRTTANEFGPEGWSLTQDNNDLTFSATESSYQIAPGGSKTFTFIWTTPDVNNSDNVYTLKVYTYKPGSTIPTSDASITLTVDGKKPTVTITVTQVGVSENNLVGTVYDSGMATVTIVASEKVSLGNVFVENLSGDNLLPPLSVSTTDNITFTATFTVGAWDAVDPRIVVESATDEVGNENNSGMVQTFTVDTKAPVFVDNGWESLAFPRPNVEQPGTGTVFLYVDNNGSKQIYGRAEDNADDTENAAWVTVYVDNVMASKDPDENFYANLSLSDGLHTITLRAVDRVGNETTLSFENIFIDTQAPIVSFDTIAGKTWTDGVKINDNTPQIKLTIRDPGYPDSGLGVAYENLFVYLDNDDNVNDILPTFGGLLENMAAWDPATGVFENVIDNLAENQGNGLAEGTYYIIVVCNDNLQHAGDNENWVIASRSFVIDVTAPSLPSLDETLNPLSGTSISNPTVSVLNTITIRGRDAEAGATVTAYIRDASTGAELATDTTTVGTDGTWSKTLTLPEEGVVLQVEVTFTDEAGNESTAQLYGYVLVDATAPSVTVSAPCSAGQTHTTADATVVVEGSITKDTWETYNTGTKAVTATIQVGSATPGTLTINSDGTFSVSAALSEGTNTITIRVVDSAGNSSSATITVVRTVTPWATYAIIIVIIALILAAIAIFRKK